MAGYFDVQINHILLTMVVLAKKLVKGSTVNDFRGIVASSIGNSWLSLLPGNQLSKFDFDLSFVNVGEYKVKCSL